MCEQKKSAISVRVFSLLFDQYQRDIVNHSFLDFRKIQISLILKDFLDFLLFPLQKLVFLIVDPLDTLVQVK